MTAILLFPYPAAADDRRAESLALTCLTCHSETDPEDGGIPPIDRLGRDELVKKLEEFRRGGSGATIMDRIAAAYTAEEIELIADYLAGRGRKR